MSLIKRGKTWHTHFFVDGQRFRQSLETSDWREAQSKEKDLIADAKAGRLSTDRQRFARLPFSEAAKRFLDDRSPRLTPSSVRREKAGVKAFKKFFGLPVARITPELILAHVSERATAGIKPATINRDLGIIRGVLKKAKRWHLFADEIKPLPVREEVGRALSYEGKLKLLKTAALRPEWQNAAWAATLALNTTMRGCEIKQLRWQDIDLMEKALTIRKSKTEAGERVIPLNADAWNTVLLLYRRAQGCGQVRPEHYVFPACEASHFDPTHPQRSWRTAWRNITRLIQCPACGKQQAPSDTCGTPECKADLKKVKSPLAGLRFHDLRHHAITELAESQASDSTVMAIAGHVSPKMLAHYSHVRIQAKRTALDSLSTKQAERANSGGKREGYDTNHDTKRGAVETITPQVIEILVSAAGFEPATHALKGHCSTN
jgi:integrase